ASRRVLEAQLEEVKAGVTGADRGLARAVVVAPFTMRISEVGATIGQAVSSGTVMVVADGVDIVEVSAQLPIGAIDPLLPPRRSLPTRDAVASDEQPTDAAPPNPDPSENEPSDEAPPRDPADGDPADVDPVDVDPAVPSRGGRGLERIAASLEARVRLES